MFLLADHSLQEKYLGPQRPKRTRKSAAQFRWKETVRLKCLGNRLSRISSSPFPELANPQIRDEMQKSKSVLEKDLSTQVPKLCLIRLVSRNDRGLKQICREAGYHFAVNTDQGACT